MYIFDQHKSSDWSASISSEYLPNSSSPPPHEVLIILGNFFDSVISPNWSASISSAVNTSLAEQVFWLKC
jgi:hypothetical protein